MSPLKNRRRTIAIVDRELQGRIIFGTSWPPLLVLAFASFLFAYFSRRLSNEALLIGAELPSLTWMLGSAGLFLLAATGFIGIQALRVSQRLAGPLHAIRRTLREFRGGKRDVRVRVRQDDYVQGIAEELNELLSWVERSLPPENADSHDDLEPVADSTSHGHDHE